MATGEFFADDLSTAAACARALARFGQAIGADRCFLYIREPDKRLGQIAAIWLKDETVPDLPEEIYHGMEPEPENLFTDDPMFKSALAGHPATFVHDVEDAGGLVDPEFEKTYRHRALAHINLFSDGKLWGVLQPAMSFVPRKWNDAERALAERARAQMTPLLVQALEGKTWLEKPLRVQTSATQVLISSFKCAALR